MGYPPYVLPTDDLPGETWWYQLPTELKTEWQAYVSSYQVPQYDGTVAALDGPCCWYDQETGQCRHHPYRPQVCRDFPAGSHGCREWRAYYQIGSG